MQRRQRCCWQRAVAAAERRDADDVGHDVEQRDDAADDVVGCDLA